MTAIEIEGLYRIISLIPLRRTVGVWFDKVPMDELPLFNSIDRVIHENGAFSPGSVENVERPWYMHPYQDDNLIVLHGIRYVDIYTPQHGRIESFEVHPSKILHNGEILFDGPCMLVWPRGVFHRIISSDTLGSASINFAIHYSGFNIKSNFNVYDVDTNTGEYNVIREGFLDQPEGGE
ncbi:hypothetical protein JW935_22340 [candidate division KSB1 bacterium]|nr:hypothetical protein [candidate division KSB1 bacterium]